MKRFYKTAVVEAAGDGHGIRLDGRPLRTPKGRELVVARRDLAAAIADEWQGQSETIVPKRMPLTRMATTTLDFLPAGRSPVVEEVAGFATADMLCYRAAEPAELVARQETAWDPLLAWAAERHGARLRTTAGVGFVDQPEKALVSLRRAVEGFADGPLIGLHAAVTVLGSVVLGLALAEDRLDPAAAFEASVLDESFVIERWGLDPEAAARRTGLLAEIEAAAAFLTLAGPVSG